MSWSEVKKINSDLKTPLNEGGVKIVKSVQRGIGTDTSIAIAEVNPDKCIVLIDGIVTTSVGLFSHSSSQYSGPYGNSVGGATLDSVGAYTLNISNVQNTYSWQLIEFY